MRTATLPARFPVGTRYVVEGRPGKAGEMTIVSRQVILPSGERFDLTRARSFGRPGPRTVKCKPGRRKA